MGAGGDDLIGLLAVPVPGVSQHCAGSLMHPGQCQVVDSGVKHRREVTKVRGAG